MTEAARQAMLKQMRRDWEDYALEHGLEGGRVYNKGSRRTKDKRHHVYINGKWQTLEDPNRKMDEGWTPGEGHTYRDPTFEEWAEKNPISEAHKTQFGPNKDWDPVLKERYAVAHPEEGFNQRAWDADLGEREKANKRLRLQSKREWEDFYAPQKKEDGFLSNTLQTLISDDRTKDILNIINRKY